MKSFIAQLISAVVLAKYKKPEGLNLWENGHIRWCADPKVSDEALNIFMLAIEQYKKALPGCFKWERIEWIEGKCEGYPETPSVYLKSTEDGCMS